MREDWMLPEDPAFMARLAAGERHWVGDAPTSLHGNGAASFDLTTRDPGEVTCRLCLSILASDPPTPAEPDAGPTCKATSFGVPTDDHVTTCWAPATEEWLDLTGQWIPVCDAHGRGRGVPEDRLRPLPATPDAGDASEPLSEEERDDLIRAFFEPDDDCAHNMTDAYVAVERIVAAREAAAATQARAEALREAADEAEFKFRNMTFYRDGGTRSRLHPVGQWLRDRAASLAPDTAGGEGR